MRVRAGTATRVDQRFIAPLPAAGRTQPAATHGRARPCALAARAYPRYAHLLLQQTCLTLCLSHSPAPGSFWISFSLHATFLYLARRLDTAPAAPHLLDPAAAPQYVSPPWVRPGLSGLERHYETTRLARSGREAVRITRQPTRVPRPTHYALPVPLHAPHAACLRLPRIPIATCRAHLRAHCGLGVPHTPPTLLSGLLTYRVTVFHRRVVDAAPAASRARISLPYLISGVLFLARLSHTARPCLACLPARQRPAGLARGRLNLARLYPYANFYRSDTLPPFLLLRAACRPYPRVLHILLLLIQRLLFSAPAHGLVRPLDLVELPISPSSWLFGSDIPHRSNTYLHSSPTRPLFPFLPPNCAGRY